MHYNEATPKECESLFGGFFSKCTTVDAGSPVSTNLVFLAVENALATCKKGREKIVCEEGGGEGGVQFLNPVDFGTNPNT